MPEPRSADPANPPPPRRRYPAAERRAAMLERAAAHFAQHGFATSTRDVAAALGVTQALIYRHFRSKDDLIERTLEAALGQAEAGRPWIGSAAALRADLTRFYKNFAAEATQTRMRLFIRAGLEGRSWPTRRGHVLTRDLFLPLIAALRQGAGLPGLERSAATRGERELVMMLHASVVFLGIRRHVYGMPMPDNLDDVVALYVATFLDGAPAAITRLHAEGSESLKATLMTPAPATGAEAGDAPAISAPDPPRRARR